MIQNKRHKVLSHPRLRQDPFVTIREVKESPGAVLVSQFLEAVRVPGTTFSALQIFLEALEKDGKQLVAELCRRTSGTEVATLLNGATKLKASDIALIFAVLDKVILTIASDLQAMESFALEMAEQLMLKHLRTFYYMLKTTNKSNQIKSALKLLVSVCTLGSKTVKTFLTHFNFSTCGFSALVARRNTVDPQDIRVCSVQLLVAIMMFGENLAVRQLAQTKNVITSVFSGLIVDRSEVIHLFLSTLLDKIVKNQTVSKTQKVQLFNQTSLKQLARVLSWNGHFKSEKEFVEDEVISKVDAAERSAVRDSVLQFLLIVCSSAKYGIVFQDYLNGTTSKNANHVLTDFLRILNFISPYHRELVRSILLAAPDQVTQFLPSWKPGFVPRQSDKWFSMMAWLDQILGDVDVVNRLQKAPSKSAAHAAVALVVPSALDIDLQHDAFSESQDIAVATAFTKFLNNAILRVFKSASVISTHEKPAFLAECRQRLIDPEDVAQYLRKKGKHLSTEEVADFLVYFHLFETVLDNAAERKFLNEFGSQYEPTFVEQVRKKISELLDISVEQAPNTDRYETPASFNPEKLKAQRTRTEAERELRQSKEHTAELLRQICWDHPRSLTPVIMDVVMCSYGATLSIADQSIFQILCILDETGYGANLVSFSLFGKSAQRHSQLHSSQGLFLPHQPTLREFIDGMDGSMVTRTAVEFPIRLPLYGKPVTAVDLPRIYDPRYLLPNFVTLMKGKQSINITHFIESGCLGVIFGALGSLDPSMRQAAGSFLQDFAKHANDLKFKGKEQLLYALRLVQRAGGTEKPWPNLWTLLFVRFFAIMFDTENPLYQVLMEFFLVKPELNLETCPEFFKLFESSSLSHAKERKFLLQLLRDGIRHYQDFDICLRTKVFESVLTMYGSPLSTDAQNTLITELLVNASRVPGAARGLVKSFGLFTWISYAVDAVDAVEAVNNLISCAGNCLKDLMQSKKKNVARVRSSCALLLKPLLKAALETTSAQSAESALKFCGYFVALGDVGSVNGMDWDDVHKLSQLSLNLLRARVSMWDDQTWRRRCVQLLVAIERMERQKKAGLLSPNSSDVGSSISSVSGMLFLGLDFD